MLLIELHELVKDEARCEEYLRSAGILKTFTKCIGCPSERVSMIRGQRFFCPDCRKEWSRRKGSLLSLIRFSYSEFLICLAYFSLEFSAEAVSREFVLNYKTVRLLYNHFRMCIGDFDEVYINRLTRIIQGDAAPIGIRFTENKISLDFEDSGNFDTAITSRRSRLQKASAFYTYDFEKLNKNSSHISELERFWRFAGKRLYNYSGTDQKYLFLFWKEIEFRYNHAEDDIFTEIVHKIAENFSG